MIKLIIKAITIDQYEKTINQFEDFQQQQISSKRKTSLTRNAIDNSTTNKFEFSFTDIVDNFILRLNNKKRKRLERKDRSRKQIKFSDRYQKKLGQGAFGCVFRMENHTNGVFARKIEKIEHPHQEENYRKECKININNSSFIETRN
jgi:hypothetical protein